MVAVSARSDLRYAPLAADPLLRALRRDGAADRAEGAATLHDELAAIGAKYGLPISLPDRPFTEDEALALALVRALLRTGQVGRTWESLVFAMRPAQAEEVLDTFAGGATGRLGMEGATGETVELFGTPLPLGPVRIYIAQARLVNEREVRAALAARPDADTPIELRFVAGEDKALVGVYLDWLPTPARAGLDAAERPPILMPEQGRRLTELFGRQKHESLNGDEQRELEALVNEYGRLLHERHVGLFALQHAITVEQARQEVDAQFDQARGPWSGFEDDPDRRREIVARARQRGGREVG
jgi:hypothetical protein